MSKLEKDIKSLLITDCGSTTTKAIWFLETTQGWIVNARAEAATTVEKPVADVTMGVVNAASSISSMMNVEMVSGENLIKGGAIDNYLSTSSAGGGLQMVVLGVMSEISAKLANKAALGGGAIVLQTVALDEIGDVLSVIESIRDNRPDIVLLSGGVDGGARDQVFELANILLSSEPRPRFGTGTKIPLVYAGNSDLSKEVEHLLRTNYQVMSVENILPELGKENLHASREAIHEIFLSHVMSQAPGYAKLMEWADADIMPTPLAVSNMIAVAAESLNASILSVDIGGATTDVFSTRKLAEGFSEVERTVSANLGMSYSIGNVISSAGIENIIRWLPMDMDPEFIQDMIWNKMYRPTTLPETLPELLIEQAVAREALRLALDQHVSLVESQIEVSSDKDFSKFFDISESGFSISDIDFILGSGGVLSHAPERQSALLMTLDAFRPKGFTFVAVDSIFMLPHLGTLASINKDASVDILLRDCIIPLGSVVSPIFKGKQPQQNTLLAKLILKSGRELELRMGMLEILDVSEGEEIKIVDRSSGVNFSLADDTFVPLRKSLCGLVLDFRDLDGYFLKNRIDQIADLKVWFDKFKLRY